MPEASSNPVDDASRRASWAVQLRRTHVRLREAAELARRGVEQGDDLVFGRDVLLHCVGFCAALSGHHAAEDRGLFPLVEQRFPDLADVLRYLRSDHAQLEHLLQELRGAVDRRESRDSLLRHLDGIDAIMESHFGYEERQLLSRLEELESDAASRELLGPL